MLPGEVLVHPVKCCNAGGVRYVLSTACMQDMKYYRYSVLHSRGGFTKRAVAESQFLFKSKLRCFIRHFRFRVAFETLFHGCVSFAGNYVPLLGKRRKGERCGDRKC